MKERDNEAENVELISIIERLSPLERKVIPFLKDSIEEIIKKTGLDEVSVLRALKFLESKEVLKIISEDKQTIELGTNGIYYKKNHLPERVLATTLEKNNNLTLEEAKKLSKLSENEFRVSLGTLKAKAWISINNGKITLTAAKEELSKKSIEEKLIDLIPIEESKIKEELIIALENLKKRKDIIEVSNKKIISINLTSLGKSLAGKEISSDYIEEITPEVIKDWAKNKKFRKYDIHAPVPSINGGKRHFVNNAINEGRRIWLDMGFKEMSGPLVDTSFWVFDALFTPQDHPAREMQDTFYLKDINGKLPKSPVVQKIKEAHEKGIEMSKGWQYIWKESEAEKPILRTHTTSLSARTLSQIKLNELPQKYFTIGKVFRNETVDWSHGFEFNQSEGIVIDEKANFQHLLGYLKEFYKKLGFSKVKFIPSFFAYTEPSVEIYAYHSQKKSWIELGGAGIFRPEVTFPLLGKKIPVLAWGPGFDRMLILANNIQDLRELYKNDIKFLREKRST